MKIDEFKFIIGSPYDREKLICEIHYKNEILAEISQETDEFILEIYPPIKDEWWSLPLEKFQDVLEKAKKHLISGE